MPELVRLTIDDKHVAVPAGTLVVDAAKSAGIDIPIFCSHRKLDPLGACRMCTVEFVGPRGSKLDTSCTVRVAEGMVVRTDTEQVKSVREANLAFLLANHPLDCPICDKGGECPLQDQTLEYGPGASRFIEPKRRKQKHYPISDLIMLDQERCILCWRCIRYLEEWEDKPQIGLFERGGATTIDVFPGQPVDAKTSGSIIDICPVGALTNRVARFRYRPWEMRSTASVCTFCPVGCNVRLDERVHELRRVVARENMAVNDEWICDKGRFLHNYVDHADRLRTPLIRQDGQLRPATWDEALALVVERFESIGEEQGKLAVGGVASARVSNEAAYLFQKFFRALALCNNVDFPDGSSVKAHITGLPAIADIAQSDLIVLAGIDPSEAVPVLALHLKRAILRAGAKTIVVHPRRIELARYASDSRSQGGAFLQPRPGDEAALLGALSNAIAGALQARKAGESRPAAAARTVRAQATVPAISPELSSAVELLLAAKSPLFIYGPDLARGDGGRYAVTALSNIAVQLGHGDKLAYVGAEGNSQGTRDMGLVADALPGHSPLADIAVRERLGKLWGVLPPTDSGLSYDDMLAGGVRALWVMGADPAAVPANVAALKGLDFLVVQDMFLTETAQLAHVVLPAVSFAEADGTYTNLERRVQRAPKAVVREGEAKADWAVVAALAAHWLEAHESEAVSVAVAADWKRKRRIKVRTGPAPKPWNYPTAQAVLEEIGKAVPAYSGIRWETLGESGQQWPFSAVARATRRFEALDAAPVAPAAAGAFALVSQALLWDGTALMQRGPDQVRNLIPAPFVALNTADLVAGGLSEGSAVIVSSERGTARLVLRADDSVAPGSAWIPARQEGAPAETLGAGRGEPVAVTLRPE